MPKCMHEKPLRTQLVAAVGKEVGPKDPRVADPSGRKDSRVSRL